MSDVQKFATFAIGLAIVGLVLNPFFAVALESDPAGSLASEHGGWVGRPFGRERHHQLHD